ncbi:MAG: MFS transporter, partial [Candidatus Firestonebacteria bacterium]|nr:MFS transporter [Candidatus Firestonebacteria bacterium]
MKSISLTIIAAFVLPYLTWAFDNASYPMLTKGIIFNHQAVQVPEALGSVQSAFQGNDKVVIHIQDLHCNYEVQDNIAKLIDRLARDHGLKLVAIEGASLPINVMHLASCPQPKVKEAVGRYLMKQGKMGGDEYYAATGKHPIALEGIEDAALYRNSREIVGEFLNDESQGYVYDLRDLLKEIQPKVYNAELLRLEAVKRASREGDIPTLKYAAQLSAVAKKVGVSLAAYPNAAWFVSNKSEAFLSARPDQVFEELERLDRDIREHLYTNREQRELDGLEYSLDVIEKMLSISVSPAELQAYAENPAGFKVKRFAEFIHRHAREAELEPELYALDRYLEKVGKFYEMADRRSGVFVEKTLQRMEKHRENLAVLITGGFHTDAILGKLKSQGISYLSVQPKITQQDLVNPYFTLLRNRKSPLEKLLAQNQNILRLQPRMPENENTQSVLTVAQIKAMSPEMVSQVLETVALVVSSLPGALRGTGVSVEQLIQGIHEEINKYPATFAKIGNSEDLRIDEPNAELQTNGNLYLPFVLAGNQNGKASVRNAFAVVVRPNGGRDLEQQFAKVSFNDKEIISLPYLADPVAQEKLKKVAFGAVNVVKGFREWLSDLQNKLSNFYSGLTPAQQVVFGIGLAGLTITLVSLFIAGSLIPGIISMVFYGLFYSVFQFIRGFGAQLSAAVQHKLGPRAPFWLPLLLAPSFILLGGIRSLWLIPLICLNGFLWNLAAPALFTLVNAQTDSTVRATVISTVNMAGSLAFVIGGPVFGLVTDQFTLSRAYF